MIFKFFGLEKEIVDNLFGVCKQFNNVMFKNFRHFQFDLGRNTIDSPVTSILKKWGKNCRAGLKP